MGASLTLYIFSPIEELLPRETRQPVLHGRHDDGHVKYYLQQGLHICLWSQEDTHMITVILIARYEKPFLQILSTCPPTMSCVVRQHFT